MVSIPSFSNLLEEYVFSVAEKVIDSVDAATQTDLIKLLYQLTPDPLTVLLLNGCLTTQPLPTDSSRPRQNSLAQQWQAVLAEPSQQSFICSNSKTKADVERLSQIYHQQRLLLTKLSQQLVQVRANLAQSQVELTDQIKARQALLERYQKYVLA